MGMGPCYASFTDLLGLSPSLNICSEGVDLCLCHDNVVFKLSIVADFSEVGPVVQLCNGLSESVVLGRVPSEHAVKPAGHGFIRVGAVVGGVEIHVCDGGRI